MWTKIYHCHWASSAKSFEHLVMEHLSISAKTSEHLSFSAGRNIWAGRNSWAGRNIWAGRRMSEASCQPLRPCARDSGGGGGRKNLGNWFQCQCTQCSVHTISNAHNVQYTHTPTMWLLATSVLHCRGQKTWISIEPHLRCVKGCQGSLALQIQNWHIGSIKARPNNAMSRPSMSKASMR